MRRLAAAVLLLAAATFAACDDGTGPGLGLGSSAGTYALQTINGNPLPFTVGGSGQTLEVLSESIALQTGGRFTLTGTQRVTQNGQAATQQYSEAGAWTIAASAITLDYDSSDLIETGTLAGGVLTLSTSVGTMVYRR